MKGWRERGDKNKGRKKGYSGEKVIISSFVISLSALVSLYLISHRCRSDTLTNLISRSTYYLFPELSTSSPGRPYMTPVCMVENDL